MSYSVRGQEDQGDFATVLGERMATVAAISNGLPCPWLIVQAAELEVVEVPAESQKHIW